MSVNSLLNSMVGMPKNYAGYNEGMAEWLNKLKNAGIITGFVSEYVSPDRPNIFTIGLSEDKKDVKLDGVGLIDKQKELSNLNGLNFEEDVLDVDIDVSYISICSAEFFTGRYLNNAI